MEGGYRGGQTSATPSKQPGIRMHSRNREASGRRSNPSTGASVQSHNGREREPDRRSASQAAGTLPEPDEADARRIRFAPARARAPEPPRDAEGARRTDHHQRLAGARSGPAAERSSVEVGADRRRRGRGAAAPLLEGFPRPAPGQGHERLPLRDHLVEDGRRMAGGAPRNRPPAPAPAPQTAP